MSPSCGCQGKATGEAVDRGLKQGVGDMARLVEVCYGVVSHSFTAPQVSQLSSEGCSGRAGVTT